MRNRRKFLTGVISASTLAIAGCSTEDIDIEENEDESTPEENEDESTPEENEDESTPEENEDESTPEENEDESTPDEGPAEVIRNYVSALDREDLEAANSYLHPDGNVAESENEQIISSVEEGFGIQVVDAEVTQQTEQSASVETELELIARGDVQTNTGTFVLRLHDNQWKIYNDEEPE